MFSGKCLHELFEAQAVKVPGRVAVTAAGESLTYGELDARANALAHRLRALGAGPDRLVGLCVDRTVDLVVGVLGILKSGAAYVPVDPAYPAQRIEFLLADSGVTALVAVRRVAGAIEGAGADVVWIDDLDTTEVSGAPKTGVTEDHVAYVIYTSGSTGTPKGVLVEHRNAVRLFEQSQELFGWDKADVWTMFHSISFDFSVWEIWGPLLYGGRLVVVPGDVARNPETFRALLREQGVTMLSQTPSAFRQLVAADLAHPGRLDLRAVVFGGERLDVKMLVGWIAKYGDDRPALVNMYGITETTVHVTFRRIVAADLDDPSASPVGGPLPAMTIHLLDESGRPVPDTEPGEMYVGGSGVARGYHNRPELTAARFVTLPDGERVYRSGDRAVRRPDGEYTYLGRGDDQIKVRGFRIEPGEIESRLTAHVEVSSAIVLPEDFGDGDVRLVAYVVPPPHVELTDQAVERLGADLAADAAASLPEYMRPSSYRVVSALPLTPQGKVDKVALRAVPYREAVGTGDEELTGTAAEVRRIVLEVLQRPTVGGDDELFDVGATSLTFMRIIALINKFYDLSLTGAEPDEATVNCLADCVDAHVRARSLHTVGG